MNEIQEMIAGLQYELIRLRLSMTREPAELCHCAAQAFSQGPEDGCIAEIFRRIGTRNRFFVEVGVGDGRENTTRLLLTLGWHGIWVEGAAKNCDAIRRDFAAALASGQLRLIEAMATPETISDLLARAGAPLRFDYLGVDIDMNTYHIWHALAAFAPRAACVEYNASIPPSHEFVVPYDPDAVWDGSNWYGASLKSLELLGAQRGYKLVGCDAYGVNAFFVHSGEDMSAFVQPFTAEKHYQPPNYLAPLRRGHWPAAPSLTSNPRGAQSGIQTR
jgi:hypothetical protein